MLEKVLVALSRGRATQAVDLPRKRMIVIGQAYFPKELLLSSVSFSLLDPNA